MKTHTCPTCGFTDECDHNHKYHSCRECGCTFDDNGIIMSGGGEPK